MSWRIIGVGVVILAVVILGFSLVEPLSGNDVSASTDLSLPQLDTSGFAQAIEPFDWQFPRDHGAHLDFQTEWWYYTGNVATDDGRRFGYQFTLFRRALSPEQFVSESEWRTAQIHMAHFTVSDIAGGEFFHDVRYSRGGANLAGVTVDPIYRVWLEDWQVIGETDDATVQRMTVGSGDVTIDLRLEQLKSPILQGFDGLSPKGDEVGQASYYYTLSRLDTTGTLSINGETFDVVGTTWMDHEFSTGALSDSAHGWDWFGLIFDDDRELMLGQVREGDANLPSQFGGMLIYPDGSSRYLTDGDFTITPTDTWVSPHTGAEYPSAWDIQVHGEDGFAFSVVPLMSDQELYGTGIEYWEGAVRTEGDVTGYGYAELTGYTESMQNRF